MHARELKQTVIIMQNFACTYRVHEHSIGLTPEHLMVVSLTLQNISFNSNLGESPSDIFLPASFSFVTPLRRKYFLRCATVQLKSAGPVTS